MNQTATQLALDYVRHTATSDPGVLRDWLADAPRTVADIRRLTSTLIFHYRAAGDPTWLGFAVERMAEIDLRYAESILLRLDELQSGPITAERDDHARVLGCCRDFTLLFVALAREAGIPARMRIGFGGYLMRGWWLDHVIAEVWDRQRGRWMLVEPQMPEGYTDQEGGVAFDLCDMPRTRFLVGADAWRTARSAVVDHERFVVDPGLPQAFLRSWPYLLHNLVLDLAAVNGDEPLLWDAWGPLAALTGVDVMTLAVGQEAGEFTIAQFDRFDELAAALAAATVPDLAPEESAERADAVYRASGLAMPSSVLTLSPLGGPPRITELRRR
ncbi:transglutaminase-like domain-containing protein [Humibacter antri]